MKKQVVLLSLFLLTTPALANKAYDIAKEADKRYSGYGDTQVQVDMLLIGKDGSESQRTLELKDLEVPDSDVNKTLMVFQAPRDIQGTALLTWEVHEESDLQWLYLPAIKRIKSISGRNRSGAFVGSEFTYEDLSPQSVEDYSYTFLREDVLDEQPVFVYERSAKNKDSGYTKEVLWVDQKEYRTLKVHYYDHKNAHTKTLTLSNYQLYQDKYWRAHALNMENLETGRKTRLSFSEFAFGTGLSESEFNKTRLKNVR